jgi:phospholipid/cholesterol/gamma-HCH transport system ATP-binding protein
LSDDILVDIEDLHFLYDGRPVLQGINMKIPRGKVVAIMGGSGCGKTTLLRCIGGQLRPTGGRVRLEKHQVCGMSQAELYRLRRRMGMLFQFGALFTDMSVFDNVAFPMREHTDLSEEMIRDLVLMKLEAVGLRGAHRLMPGELSGGMARRVALARALALDPMLVMYDEPFTGLDPIALGVIGQLIRKLNDALGATSIMVTHDIQESLLIVDYIYFLNGGLSPKERPMRSGPRRILSCISSPCRADGPVHFDYPAPTVRQEFLAGVAWLSIDPPVGPRRSSASGGWVLLRASSGSCCCIRGVVPSPAADPARNLFQWRTVPADHSGFRSVRRLGAWSAGL